MRARGKRSSCAPTPPANPIPIASVERGRGRGKGRREEERGGRRHTWNLAPARRMQLPPRESGPSATRLRERDSSPVCDRLPLRPPRPACSPATDSDSGPVPNRDFALRPRDWQLRPPLLFPLLLCGSPLAPPSSSALPPPSSSALPLPRSHALLLPVLYFAFSALLVSPIYELQFDSWNGYTY